MTVPIIIDLNIDKDSKVCAECLHGNPPYAHSDNYEYVDCFYWDKYMDKDDTCEKYCGKEEP